MKGGNLTLSDRNTLLALLWQKNPTKTQETKNADKSSSVTEWRAQRETVCMQEFKK